MLLENKIAVIYGAGGAIGSAVARAFAREGARLFLAGRHGASVEAVARDVIAAGGSAEAAEVDALDEQDVDGHLQSVIDKSGRIDVSFNAVGMPNTKILGVPLVALDVEQFLLPIAIYARSYLLTARLAARRMVANRSGVIMTVTALHSRMGIPLVGGYGPRDGRQGGTHSRSVCRARTSWHSRGWSAPAGHAGDTHDQRRVRASRQGSGNDVGTVARIPRKQNPRSTTHGRRRAGKHGGIRGFQSGKRDDRNHRQLDHGEPG
jgi:NAD(P)-dependent dehydrogenase (short-subunit alcohol dehydrogenase family)